MSFNDDMRNNSPKCCYLFYGEEKYLLRQAQRRLSEYFGGAENELSSVMLDGAEVTLGEAVREANTVSFFSDRKLVTVRSAPYFSAAKKSEDEPKEKDKAGTAALAAFLEDPPPQCCLLFIAESAPDKRLSAAKLLDKRGMLENFAPLDRQAQQQWLNRRFAAAGKKAQPELLNRLAAVCGGSLYAMEHETEKLLLYCADKQVITAEDCAEILSPSAELSVFDLVDAVSQRQGRQALALYEEMLARGEAAQRIAVLLLRQFHNMLAVSDMKRQGLRQQDMKRELGIEHDFVIGKLGRFVSRFTAGELMRVINDILNADYAQKSGGRSMDEALKDLILKISVPR